MAVSHNSQQARSSGRGRDSSRRSSVLDAAASQGFQQRTDGGRSRELSQHSRVSDLAVLHGSQQTNEAGRVRQQELWDVAHSIPADDSVPPNGGRGYADIYQALGTPRPGDQDDNLSGGDVTAEDLIRRSEPRSVALGGAARRAPDSSDEEREHMQSTMAGIKPRDGGAAGRRARGSRTNDSTPRGSVASNVPDRASMPQLTLPTPQVSRPASYGPNVARDPTFGTPQTTTTTSFKCCP